MAANFKVEIISKEVIKPSSPSPDHPRHLNLSIFDQLLAPIYVPLLLFYAKDEGEEYISAGQTEKSRRLKTSLAETLNQFYPVAGRAKGINSIDCNDEGVAFFEALIDCDLSDFLKEPECGCLKNILPTESQSLEAYNGFLLLVQANFFRCGGMAVGVSISHTIADASSLNQFIKSWSAAALCSDHVPPPYFIGDSLFPGEIPEAMAEDVTPRVDFVTKRFVFTAKAIKELKATAVSAKVEKPTRFEAIAGILWKSFIAASREKQSSEAKKSALCLLFNLRKRFSPPLPETTVGNLVGFSIVETEEEDKKAMVLQDMVQQLREASSEFSTNGVKRFQGGNAVSKICEDLDAFGKLLTSEDVDICICSSWSRFGFYDANFGCGRPAWVGITAFAPVNSFVLVDAQDGEGIEAWVNLGKETMASFQHQEELLLFASPNPSLF